MTPGPDKMSENGPQVPQDGQTTAEPSTGTVAVHRARRKPCIEISEAWEYRHRQHIGALGYPVCKKCWYKLRTGSLVDARWPWASEWNYHKSCWPTGRRTKENL